MSEGSDMPQQAFAKARRGFVAADTPDSAPAAPARRARRALVGDSDSEYQANYQPRYGRNSTSQAAEEDHDYLKLAAQIQARQNAQRDARERREQAWLAKMARHGQLGAQPTGSAKHNGLRGFISRLLFGGEDVPKRALIDPNELLAAELFQLTALDPRWGFMQSARRVGNQILLDHWAVGPGGVYLLNAKHLPGSRLQVRGDEFLVDGLNQPFVPEIRYQARRGSDYLTWNVRWEVGVTGVIVPVEDRKLTVMQSPIDVAVIDDMDVANWLVNRPEQYGKQKILTTFQAARHASSWQPGQQLR